MNQKKELKKINIIINGQSVSIQDGATVSAAIFQSDLESFRRSVSGESRFPLCGMGICFECRVTINGVGHQRSCQIPAEEGMMIETDG